MRRITSFSLSKHHYITFEYGLEKLSNIAIKIMDSKKLDADTMNILLKEIVINLRYLGIECTNTKSDESMTKICEYVKELILRGMRSGKHNHIEYQILVIQLEKIGISATENTFISVIDEVLDSLGKIGELSLTKEKLIHPPIGTVLFGLQNIGIECAKKRLGSSCLNALNRIESISDLSLGLGNEDVLKSALKEHWILSAFIHKYISEADNLLTTRKDNAIKKYEKYISIVIILHWVTYI